MLDTQPSHPSPLTMNDYPHKLPHISQEDMKLRIFFVFFSLMLTSELWCVAAMSPSYPTTEMVGTTPDVLWIMMMGSLYLNLLLEGTGVINLH